MFKSNIGYITSKSFSCNLPIYPLSSSIPMPHALLKYVFLSHHL